MFNYEIKLTRKSSRLVNRLMEQHFANYGEMLSVQDAINILISGDKYDK